MHTRIHPVERLSIKQTLDQIVTVGRSYSHEHATPSRLRRTSALRVVRQACKALARSCPSVAPCRAFPARHGQTRACTEIVS